jgi:hypothetical protein
MSQDTGQLTTKEAINRGLFTTEQLSKCVPTKALLLVKAARVWPFNIRCTSAC